MKIAPKDSNGFGALYILLIALVVSVAGAVTWLALSRSNSQSSNEQSSCAPLTGDSLKNAAIQSAYTNFVNAVKDGDQGCVDSLSSGVFKSVAAKTYGVSDGDWLDKALSSESGVSSLRDLPDNLVSTNFKEAEYTRPEYDSSFELNDTSQPEGVTLKYPTKSEAGYTVNINFSFIVQNNKILVDELKVVPAQLDRE